MVASTVTPAAAQPPPDLPPLPEAVRRCPIICAGSRCGAAMALRDKFGLQSSTPHVYMTSPHGSVFKISISDSGLLLSTAITPGSGKETTPVMTFSPVTTTNSGSKTHGGSVAGGSSYHMVGLTLTVYAGG